MQWVSCLVWICDMKPYKFQHKNTLTLPSHWHFGPGGLNIDLYFPPHKVCQCPVLFNFTGKNWMPCWNQFPPSFTKAKCDRVTLTPSSGCPNWTGKHFSNLGGRQDLHGINIKVCQKLPYFTILSPGVQTECNNVAGTVFFAQNIRNLKYSFRINSAKAPSFITLHGFWAVNDQYRHKAM